MEDAECSEMMIKHWSDIPSFSDLADIDTTPGLTPLVTPAVDEVQLSVTSSAGHTEQFSAKGMVHDDLRGAIASRFSCAKAGFVLRDVEAGGSIVPVSPTLTGSFKLEVSRADTGAAGAAPPHAPARAPGIPAAAAADADAEGGRPPAMGSIQMHFTMEPPHGPAVWLHAKLTSAGGVANSCLAHVLAPPPRIRMRGGEPSAHEELLGRVCFALCDAAGAPVPRRVLHPGEAVITRVTAEGRRQQGEGLEQEEEEEVWEASWPRMAITDTSRSASKCGLAEQKLTAAELQAPRGATGWFSLRAFVPPAASGAAGGAPPVQDLWLRDVTGRKARIVVKNERNAALSWQKDKVGPFADHSLCAARGSHVDANGRRLCRHGKCTQCAPQPKFIKAEAAADP